MPADMAQAPDPGHTDRRIACKQMTTLALEMLRDSVGRAASLPTRPGWDRKAAAHAEIFRLLGEIAGYGAARGPDTGAGAIRDLMRMGGTGRQRG